MRIIGIDPGLDGGIAIVHPHLGEEMPIKPIVTRMPIIQLAKSKRWYDLQLIKDFITKDRERGDYVFIEKQQTMPKQGISGAGKLMRGFGLLEGLVCGLEFPYQIVGPKTWMAKVLREVPGEGKNRAILFAGRFYPRANLIPDGCRKPHSGIADALGIATHGLYLLYKNELKT